MKPILVAVIGMALLAILGCTSQNTRTAQPALMPFVPLQHSMKGWELYSWRYHDEWHFVLAVGTNRIKAANELASIEGGVVGTEAIKAELARLPKNEEVIWRAQDIFQLGRPPQSIIDEIRDYCARSGIQLTVV